MLKQSQPIKLPDIDEETINDMKSSAEQNIINQFIGILSDLDKKEKPKITIRKHIGWKWRNIKSIFRNIKYTIRNHIKWHKNNALHTPVGRF